MSWKNAEAVKARCAKAEEMKDFMRFYESYKDSYMPLAEDAFQNGLSHKWLKNYSKFIDPEVARKSETLDTQAIPGNSLYQQAVPSLESDTEVQLQENYLDEQLKLNRCEYSIEEALSVYIVSYNAGGKKPKKGVEMPTGFFTGKSSTNESFEPLHELPDIYAICIQEVCPLNPKNVITKSNNPAVWEEYLHKALNCFGEKYGVEYERVAADCMVGLFTVVFLKKDKASLCNNVATSSVPVGVFGIVVTFAFNL